MKGFPQQTNKLRRLMNCLGFIADNFSARRTHINYRHRVRHSEDKYRDYIGIPHGDIKSKNITHAIITELHKFQFTDSEIKDCI